MAHGRRRRQLPKGERPVPWFIWAGRVTNGAEMVTSGGRPWPAWATAYLVVIVIVFLAGIVNVLTVLHDVRRMGRALPAWEPAVWEATSGLVWVALAWVPLLMARRFPPGAPRWRRTVAAHLAVTIPFSLVHIGLMVSFRHGAYALMGETYDFGLSAGELLYEYRKDLLTYSLFAAIFWASIRLQRGRSPEAPDAAREFPETFDINEGQRLNRVDRADILSGRSCGNYVEFTLIDGRQPLMRTTLAKVENDLAGSGFVRTHRSWLVNSRHVVEIAAAGSGDHDLRLSNGAEVPLSRRYPHALALLRAPRTRKWVDI